MGINRQDPNLINSEINVVSYSIEKTEKAMNELISLPEILPAMKSPRPLFEERKRGVKVETIRYYLNLA